MCKRKVIIDCDPGIDDALALLYAVNAPELDVVAVTIVCGNVPVELGVKNALICLEKCGRLDIPIYAGAAIPLVREFISAQDTHGMDGLGESNQCCKATGNIQQLTAAEYLSMVFTTKTDISVIALGPLTNIAMALQKNSQLGQNMARFVSMGGAYKSHGNCSPVAEYNYWCDPDAAAYVYEKLQQKIEMVGLDVTRSIVFTPNLLAYCLQINPEIGQFIEDITRFYFAFHWQQEHILGCVINDPLAVAYFIDPALCRGFDSYTVIETTGIGMGQSIVDAYGFWQKPANTHVLTEVEAISFFRKFLTVILHAPAEIIAADLENLRLG